MTDHNRYIETGDGSASFYSDKYEEPYHSIHGALQESLHVFIKMGLEAQRPHYKELSILEMGLGTGLNALLTYQLSPPLSCHYTALEAEPINLAQAGQLNYAEQIGDSALKPVLNQIHELDWNQPQQLSPQFTFTKVLTQLQDFETTQKFDLVYFDAFAPDAQPELWTEEIFAKIYSLLNPGAVLTTYCAKGAVRRAMIAAGFTVEKVPGPPGKREMLRAKKESL